MPDFIRLTPAGSHDHPDDFRKIIVVTSMIGAVFPLGSHTRILVQGVPFDVRESVDFICTAMGVPTKKTIIDNRDRPVHELSDEELTMAWTQWCERKSIHSQPVAVLIEFELKRRGIVVGESR